MSEKYKFHEIIILSTIPVINQIHLYAVNSAELNGFISLLIISGGIFLNIILYFILNKFLKNSIKSIIISIIISFFIFYTNLFLDNPIYIAISWGLILLCDRYNLKNIIKFTIPFLITLLIINSGYIIYNSTNSYILSSTKNNTDVKISNIAFNKRNIYILLCDMYSGTDTLSKLGFDNSSFIKTLEEKGFIVYNNILSNYNKTQASLPSFLNFDYAENITQAAPSEAISNSILFRLAKSANYKVFYLNSWTCEFKISGKYIDVVYETDSNTINETINLLLKHSYLRRYIKNTKELEGALDFINEVIRNKKSKNFLFAHILMPHWPYMYDKNGNKLQNTKDIYVKKTGFNNLNKESYLSFLQYTNSKILDIVSTALKSEEKPIIIIMGDHGVRTTYCHGKKNQLCRITEYEQNKIKMPVLTLFSPIIIRILIRKIIKRLTILSIFTESL